MDSIDLHDIADGGHLCVALGLTSPAAALVTDTVATLIAIAALTAGHRRPAATLAGAAAASAATAVLLH